MPAVPVADSRTALTGGVIAAGRFALSPFWRDLLSGWTNITPTGTAPYHGILAYSAIGFDQIRGILYASGGGHNDYSGEDIWSQDYENRLPWVQHYLPMIYQGIPLATAQSLCDNVNWPGALVSGGVPIRPISRHTYKAVHWVESIQQLAVGGGSTFGGNSDYLWYQEGAGTGAWWNDPGDYWNYEPNSKVWTYKGSRRKNPAYDPTGSQHIYAREIDRIFAIGNNGNNQLRFTVHDPQANTWTVKSGVTTQMLTDAVGCYDSTRNKIILLVVNNYAMTAPEVVEYDVATDTFTTLATTGPIPTGWYMGSGMVYSPRTNTCLFLENGAGTLQKLNLDTLVWTSEAHPLPSLAQVEGRWFYDTKRNVALLVYTTGTDVRIYAYKE